MSASQDLLVKTKYSVFHPGKPVETGEVDWPIEPGYDRITNPTGKCLPPLAFSRVSDAWLAFETCASRIPQHSPSCVALRSEWCMRAPHGSKRPRRLARTAIVSAPGSLALRDPARRHWTVANAAAGQTSKKRCRLNRRSGSSA